MEDIVAEGRMPYSVKQRTVNLAKKRTLDFVFNSRTLLLGPLGKTMELELNIRKIKVMQATED